MMNFLDWLENLARIASKLLIILHSHRWQFLRFLLSGSFNTLATWGIYIGLLKTMPYWLSYTLAFVVGIFFAYIFNRYFVFKNIGRRYSFLWLVLVYLCQYLAGLALVTLWVKLFPLLVVWATLFSTICTIPVTYILSGLVFSKNDNKIHKN